MKKIIVVILALCLLFTACKPQLDPPDDFTGNPGDLGIEINLTRLTLDKTELATIGGSPLQLIVTKTPVFATNSEVTWTSSNPNAATVDGNGNVYTDAAVTTPLTTVIRVESAADSSIYAECPVTVYPNYGSNRYWNFGSDGWYATSRDAPTAQQTKFGSIVLTADSSLGMGMTLKGQTGLGSYEPPTKTPDGLPLEGGLKPAGATAAYPSYPWVYEIDPKNPYMWGLTPTGGTRGGMNWNDSEPTAMGFRKGNLITNGAGRILSIAAIRGPFSIEVRYTSNSDGSSNIRWADIRIGDAEGLRIQGSPSDHRTNESGRGIVSYNYTNNDIVPFVYVEAQASIRIYEVIITSNAPDPYTPVQSASINPSTLTMLDNTTSVLTAVVSPPAATAPVYQWEIIEGAENGTIVSGASTNLATVRKIGKTGDFKVKLTVTTTNPDTGEATAKTAEIQIGATPYKAVTGASITGDSSVQNGKTITLTAAVTPTDATYPEYTWSIDGADATIDGSSTGATVRIKGAADSGSVTVNLSVTTTGGNGETDTVNAPGKTINLEAAQGGAYFEWDAATASAFTLDGTNLTSTISGKTWRRTAGTISFTAGDPGFTLANGRFVIGSKLDADTTSASVYDPAGELDFTTKKKITVTYTCAKAGGTFYVYLNNNTTSQGSSVHGNSSRLVNKSLTVVTNDTVSYIVDPATFSNHASLATSFLQIRVDSSGSVVISKILIEDVN